MQLNFIYWRKNNEQDGLSPYSVDILRDMVRLVNNRTISFYLSFPIDLEIDETVDYSVTDYALKLARKFVDSGFLKSIKMYDNYEEAIDRFKREFILNALNRNEFNILKTSRELDISRKTIYRTLKKYNITRPK